MKYMGSKNRIAKYIVPILEKNFYENDCEIFIDGCCGGCNLVDKVDESIPRYANDINKYLIEMFKGLQKGIEYPEIIDKDLYNLARDVYNKKEKRFEHIMNMTDDVVGWIGWMGSYNGRFFDGGYSGHDVKGRDYIGEQVRNTKKQIQNLKNVIFSNKSLFDIDPKKKSLIYFDIPYKDTKQYASSKDFDYDMFYNFCKKLKEKGHIVFVSEYNMPIEFECIWSKEVTNSLNTKNTYKPVEKLFKI